MADVIARLDEMPEVVDHAGAREERSLGVDRDPQGLLVPSHQTSKTRVLG